MLRQQLRLYQGNDDMLFQGKKEQRGGECLDSLPLLYQSSSKTKGNYK